MTRHAPVPVGSIRQPFDYGIGGAEGPKIILYADGRDPQIQEVWAFVLVGITHKVHPTPQVDVVAGVVGDFSSNYCTSSGRRIPILG